MNQITNYGLDLVREQAELKGDEWVFGATSKPCAFSVPTNLRDAFLPMGEVQRGREDFQDCVTRGYLNLLETKFTYAYTNGLMKEENRKWLREKGYTSTGKITFSDRFIAMLSGTTRTGNSLKAPAHAIHKFGLVPKDLLPKRDDMDFDQYHNKADITPEMEKLGVEFLARFPLNYEQVYLNDLEKLLENDMVNLAGFAWPRPVMGEYPKTEGAYNHAFMGIRNPRTYIFDNYPDEYDGDFIKKLAPDYNLNPYGYRVFISRETTEDERKSVLSVWDILKKYGLLAFFTAFWERFSKTVA